jgi:hypothetical protein
MAVQRFSKEDANVVAVSLGDNRDLEYQKVRDY